MIAGPSQSPSALIDAQPLSRFQIGIICMCGAVAMLDGFDAQAIAFVAPAIAQTWGLGSSQLGAVFSLGLVGVLIGALVQGPISDRIGRRATIILPVAAFGALTGATALVNGLPMLMFLRLATGIGLGAAVPNIIALTAEYSPARRRTFLVAAMYAGFPLGGFLGGLLSAQLIANFGWPSVFVFGGLGPLVLTPLLAIGLPESVPFLIQRERRRTGPPDARNREAVDARIAGYLERISPEAARRVSILEASLVLDTPSRGGLFSGRRAVGTPMLWLVFFLNQLMLYFLLSWLPAALAGSGLPLSMAILTSAILNLGAAAGGLILGHMGDRIGAYIILGAAYIAGACLCIAIGFASQRGPIPLAVVASLTGFCVGGSQLVANAIASMFYPTSLRSTGIGAAAMAGRIGAIAGPAIGGGLMALKFNSDHLFGVLAGPGVLAAAAVYVMSRSASRAPVASSFSCKTTLSSEENPNAL